MRLTGRKVIEEALALLGSHAPGEQAEDRLIDQAVVHANAQLESLALDSQYIPGETAQVIMFRKGVSDYWLGPEFVRSGTPDAPVAPFGLLTSGIPEMVVRARPAVLDADGDPTQLDSEGSQRYLVPGNDDEAASIREALSSGAIPGVSWLILHDGASGPGPGPVSPPSRSQIPPPEAEREVRSFVRGNKRLEVLPAPAADVAVRLYLKIPEITLIARDNFYEFPQGVGQVLLTQIASALATVYGIDPDTRGAIEQRANIALDRYKGKNARFRRTVAHLPRRWLGTVSEDGGSFEVNESIYR